MKRKLLLVCIICVSFAIRALAQTGWYIETTKFDKFPLGGIEMRYDKINRLNLTYRPMPGNNLDIVLYDYDPVGNRIRKTALTLHKDPKNPIRYPVDIIEDTEYTYDASDNLTKTKVSYTLDEKQFGEVVQKIMDRLDQK